MSYACQITNKNWVRVTKNVARETTLVAQKYRMFVCEIRACHRTKHKNIVSLVVQKSYLSSKKTEIAFVRQKNCRTGDIKLSPKNTECIATKAYRRTTDKNSIFVRQDLSPVRQFCHLKTQKLNTGDISSSYVRQYCHPKIQSVLVR